MCGSRTLFRAGGEGSRFRRGMGSKKFPKPIPLKIEVALWIRTWINRNLPWLNKTNIGHITTKIFVSNIH